MATARSFSWQPIAVIGIVIALTIALLILWFASYIFLVIFAAILFAILVDGLAMLMIQWISLPRGLARGVVIVLLLVAIAAFLTLAGPRVSSQLSQLADAPNMIVTSRLADERLWAEVLNVGGYDLLVAPYDRDEVVRIAAQAWLDWERKRAVRYQVATGASYSPFDLAGRVAVTEPRDQGGLLAFPPGDDSVLDKGAHGYQAKVSSR